MVGSVFKYSGVITKLRAMYSRLLKEPDYEALASMTSVGEVVHYLKSAPGYAELLAEVSEATVHREMLERLFGADIQRDAKKLSTMLGEKEKRVLWLFMSKYEIDLLKRAARCVIRGTSGSEAAAANSGLGDFSRSPIDVKKCFEAGSLKELAAALKGTDYGALFSRFAAVGSDSLFDIESALDELYFERLRNGVRRFLSGGDRKAVLAFLSEELNVRNILWIYRYKKYYNMTPEEILNHLILTGEKAERQWFLHAASLDLKEIPGIARGRAQRSVFQEASDLDWDGRLNLYLLRLYHRQLRNDAYSFSTVIAYLYLKEIDINNIITVLESVRYGVSPEKIRASLTVLG